MDYLNFVPPEMRKAFDDALDARLNARNLRDYCNAICREITEDSVGRYIGRSRLDELGKIYRSIWERAEEIFNPAEACFRFIDRLCQDHACDNQEYRRHLESTLRSNPDALRLKEKDLLLAKRMGLIE